MTDETETTAADEPQDISALFDDSTRTEEGATEAESIEAESTTGETETEDKGETESPSEEPQEATEGESEAQPEEAESEPPSDNEGESVPRQALLDERRKRQEAQEEAERLKREYGIQQDEEAPDPRDDPEGYEKYVRQKVERENWEKRVTQSRERMLEKHADFEEKEKHFVQLAQQNPDLVKQMNEHPDPAGFAYEKAQEDMSSKEKAIEDRVIERLRKEGKLKEDSNEEPKSKGKAAESASRVADLTSAAGAGNNTSDQVQESHDPQDVFSDLSY